MKTALAPLAAVMFAAVVASPAFGQPSISAVVNEASSTTSLSPGVLATVFGSDLNGTNLAVTLGAKACAVLFTSPTQLNIELPVDAPLGASNLVVSHDGMNSAGFVVTLNAYAPAALTVNGSGTGRGVFVDRAGRIVSIYHSSKIGNVLTEYGVGLGATNPPVPTGMITPSSPEFPTVVTPTVSVDGQMGSVSFSGLSQSYIGLYQVNFTVPAGVSSGVENVTWTIGGITSPPVALVVSPISKVAVWQSANWFIDQDDNHRYDGPPSDKFIQWGSPGVTPVMGDWNGDGRMKIGLFFQGLWYLDYNGDGVFEPGTDKVYNFGTASSTPVVGDWNGDGRTKIGIYQSGVFILDKNGDGIFEAGTDLYFGWGPTSGAQPVIGDWSGNGTSKVGVFQEGFWALDYNGDGVYEPGTDKFFGWGAANGTPIVGDWNGSGTTKVGSFSVGAYGPDVGQFVLDVNGDFMFEPGTDAVFPWGDKISMPVVGDWDGDGRDKVGVFSNGFWVLDFNGDYAYEPGTDLAFQFGGCGAAAYPCGQEPVPGKW